MILSIIIITAFILSIVYIITIEVQTNALVQYANIGDYCYIYINEVKEICKITDRIDNLVTVETIDKNSHEISISGLYPIIRYKYKK